MKIKIENISYEIFIVKFFQSEDDSWNYAFFTDFHKAVKYAESVFERGFSPVIEEGYLEHFDYDEDEIN